MHTFLAPGPIAFAHRGGSEEAPENTLPAFESAVGMGYTYLETDVHLTADGVLAAFHDSELDRVTNQTGRIDSLAISEVERADAGFRFTRDGGRTHPFRGRGVKVPRLAELLESFPSARFNIDPKADSAVIPLLVMLERFAAFDRVCIGSFSERRLAMIRTLSRGRACTSLGPLGATRLRAGSWLRLPRRSRPHADCIQVPVAVHAITIVDERLIGRSHGYGLPVHVWTVNQEHEMERLLDLGVDGIMTDRPRALADVFARRGLALNGRDADD